jgi:hypothetical protein
MHNDAGAPAIGGIALGDRMALFLSLYLGHVLGDFVFQPAKLVEAKRTRSSGMFVHAFIVLLATAAAGLAALPRTWPAVALSALAHLGVEQLSVRARRVAGSSNLAVFMLDQALHIVSLVLIATVFAEAMPASVLAGWQVSMRTLAAACALATVAFFGSILVFELELSDAAAGRTGTAADRAPDPLLGLDASRFYGMIERAGALGAALISGVPAVGALLFVPRLVWALTGPSERRNRNLIALVAGLGLCIVAWAFVSVLSVS